MKSTNGYGQIYRTSAMQTANYVLWVRGLVQDKQEYHPTLQEATAPFSTPRELRTLSLVVTLKLQVLHLEP